MNEYKLTQEESIAVVDVLWAKIEDIKKNYKRAFIVGDIKRANEYRAQYEKLSDVVAYMSGIVTR